MTTQPRFRIARAEQKANYGARAGQVIAGNLGRGGDGKFVNAGSGSGPTRASTYATRPSTRRAGKPAKGRAGKKPDATQSEQEKIAGSAGLGADDLRALQAFDAGGTLDSATAAKLATAGLVDIGSDGAPRLAPNVDGALSALRKGDARAASDALGRARDRKASLNNTAANRATNAQKRTEAAAARAQSAAQRRQAVEARRADAARKRDEKRGASNAQRTERQQVAARAEAARISNRVEVVATRANEISTGDGWAKKQTERKRLGNQLEEAAAKVSTLAIPDDEKAKLTAQISSAMSAMEWGVGDGETFIPAPSTVKALIGNGAAMVFKDSSGSYRWVTYSSNAFEDCEEEIVSLDALTGAVQRMDKQKAYGPARWWHLGAVMFKDVTDWESVYAGEGLDLGVCDFSEVHNHVLVESGTFVDELVGESFAEIAEKEGLQVSIGFTHPDDQPVDGVYKDIAIFERSFLPVGKAANLRTGVAVITNKEQDMSNQITGIKLTALKTLLGAKADQVLTILNGADAVAKEAIENGAKFKEDAAAVAAQAAAASDAAQATTDSKAGDMPAGDGGDVPAEDAAPEDAGDFVGDMSSADFKAMMAEMNAPIVEALTAIAGVIGAGQKEATEQTTKAANDLKITMATFNKRLKSLEGDAPGSAVYRATEDQSNKTEQPASTVKQAPENELVQLADFWVNGNTGKA